MKNTLIIRYQDENVLIETILVEHDIQYKVNFEQAIYLEKEVDEDGLSYWIEVGTGATLRAKEIGEMIESHPEFI